MNIARLNMSHSDHKNAKKVIDRIKKLNKEVLNPVGILLDTQGPEIRTGNTSEVVNLEPGQLVSFTIRDEVDVETTSISCLLYTSPSPRDVEESRMPSSA